MSYTKEFPDFDPATMPAIPCGFDDVSWHNDTCPSFLNETSGLIIFVDYADASLREFPECPRYTLGVWDNGNTGNDVVSTDDWREIESHVLARAFAANIEADLTADELAEIKRRNASTDYFAACATHDFVDANMNMHEVFIATFGREPLFGAVETEDGELWNRAWDIAKREYLTAKV